MSSTACTVSSRYEYVEYLPLNTGKSLTRCVLARVAFMEVARERLAEVGTAVVGRASGVCRSTSKSLAVALDQHRHRAGTLGLLAGAAALVFGDIGAHHDGQLVGRRRTARSAARSSARRCRPGTRA